MKFSLYKLTPTIDKKQFHAYIFCQGKIAGKPVDHEGKRIKLTENINPAFVAFAQAHLQRKIHSGLSGLGIKCVFQLTNYTQVPYFILSKEDGERFRSFEIGDMKFLLKMAIKDANEEWLIFKEREEKKKSLSIT